MREVDRVKGGVAQERAEEVVPHDQVDVPEMFANHWFNSKKVHKRCIVCEEICYKECRCGAGVCHSGKSPCMLHHIERVMLRPEQSGDKRPRRHIMA